jgi:hypothetical protein
MTITERERHTIRVLANEYGAWHGMRVAYPDSPNYVDYCKWENEALDKLDRFLSEITEKQDEE